MSIIDPRPISVEEHNLRRLVICGAMLTSANAVGPLSNFGQSHFNILQEMVDAPFGKFSHLDFLRNIAIVTDNFTKFQGIPAILPIVEIMECVMEIAEYFAWSPVTDVPQPSVWLDKE